MNLYLVAAITVLVVIAIAAIYLLGKCRAGKAAKEGYLIYPYLDLDAPGERGSYYAMSECGGR